MTLSSPPPDHRDAPAADVLLQALRPQIPNGSLYLLDRDLRIILAEGLGLLQPGGSTEQMVGRTVTEVLPAVSAATLIQSFQQALAGEYVTVALSHSGRPYRITAFPLPDGSGAVPAILVVVVTERAPSVAPAAGSDRHLRAIWESAGDAMVLCDADGIVRVVNPSYCDLSGYTADEIVGQPFALVFPAEKREWAMNKYRRTFSGPETAASVQSVIRRKDGGERTVEAHFTFLTEGGCRFALLSVVRDVSERVRAEAAFQASHDRLQVLAETASGLLLSEDPQTVVRDLFHRLAETLDLEVYFHYRVEKERAVLQLDSCEGVPDEVSARIASLDFGQAVCGTAARDRRVIVAEHIQASEHQLTELVRSLGIEAYACHPLIAYGRLVGTLSFGTRRRTCFTAEELALLRAVCDQVAMAVERARLLEAEREARATAEAALQMRTHLLFSISHDLRNPLTTIRGVAQMHGRLARRLSVPDASRLVAGFDSIETSATQIAGLLDELADLARLDTGHPLELRLVPVDLVQLARRQAGLVQQTTRRHRLQVETALPELIGAWDGARLERVVANLLSNAVKYSPNGGAVIVRVSREPGEAYRDWARLSVTDHGLGIPPADLPQVFDRFHRGANVVGRIAGCGIGLAGVKQIIDQHEGTITIESTEGHGTSAVIRLPLN